MSVKPISMHACLVDHYGKRLRTSIFRGFEEAKAYADTMPGVVAIERLGVGVVWERVKDAVLEK